MAHFKVVVAKWVWSGDMLMLAGMVGLLAISGIAFMGDTVDGNGDSEEPVDPLENPNDGVTTVADVSGFPVGNTSDCEIPGEGENQILSGDETDNIITGGVGDDQINGYAGDDTVSGDCGDDTLHGGQGDDVIYGGDDRDTLHGEDGNDILNGNSGDDQLFGHEDGDSLYGGDGQDMLDGGQGDDTLHGGGGGDALHGGLGNDRLDGGDGQDTLFGGWGDDWISGIEDGPLEPDAAIDAQSDFLNGGGGDDMILAGQSDIVTAGAGSDTIVLNEQIGNGEAVTLMDFNIAEDRLLMVCDLAGDTDPTIEITSDSEMPGVNHIMINGVEIALVHSDDTLNSDDIVLVDFADAPALQLNA